MRRKIWLAVLVPLHLLGCNDTQAPAAGGSAAGATAGKAGAKAAPTEPEFDSSLPAEDQDKVVARIGDNTITLREFERRLKQQAPYARARYASPERKKEFLDNLVRFEVLAAEAARRGYDRDADVVQQMKQTMVRKLMTQEVNNLVKLSDITEAEMKKYYDDHAATYHKPAQVRVSQVLVADGKAAKKLYGELKRKIAADRKSYRKVFADFAKEHSTDALTKARGGDLRFFAKTDEGGAQPKAVSDAAFAMESIGDLSEPVQSEKGWHILLLTGRKNRYDRTFDQVKRQIQNRLYRQKKREATDTYVADLKAKAKVETDDALLAKVEVAGPPRGGPRGAHGAVLGPVDPSGPAPGVKAVAVPRAGGKPGSAPPSKP